MIWKLFCLKAYLVVFNIYGVVRKLCGFCVSPDWCNIPAVKCGAVANLATLGTWPKLSANTAVENQLVICKMQTGLIFVVEILYQFVFIG